MALVIIGGGLWYWKNKKDTPAIPVEFAMIDRGNYGLYGQGMSDLNNAEERFKKMSVSWIDNQADWKRFWETYVRQVGTGGFDKIPEVDFQNRVIVGILQGVKPTGGFYLLSKEVQQTGNVLIVKVEINEPKETDNNTQAVSAPYEIISLPASVNKTQWVEIVNMADGKSILKEEVSKLKQNNK